MAKMVAFSGEVSEYQGRPVSPAIKYSGESKEYETIAEVKEAGEWPNDKEILTFVNKKAFTAAKAKSYQEATKELKKAYEDSPEYKFAETVKNIMAMNSKLSRAQAEELAKSISAMG
jgi:hypothetical protein